MPYLIASDLSEAPAGARFRAALARPGILQLPGAHSGMAALQARAAGFQALYLSGAAMTASMGLPDLYPFVLSAPVITKLGFVHDLVASAQRAGKGGPGTFSPDGSLVR